VEGSSLLDRKSISLRSPFQERYPLLSEEDQDYSFFVEVYQSSKNLLKVTFHFQEDNANYGLLRVDYGGRHRNPEMANEHVPEVCLPYCGQWLDTPHIHFAVPGYRPLAWAVPLETDGFAVRSIRSFSEISDALSAFFTRINVQTQITVVVQTDAFL
jgi:hypothetical protein